MTKVVTENDNYLNPIQKIEHIYIRTKYICLCFMFSREIIGVYNYD